MFATSSEAASWAMSTPGSVSGIFNTTPLEDDDDLLVPSLLDHHFDHLDDQVTYPSSPADGKDIMAASCKVRPVPQLRRLASSSAAKRTFSSDFRLYVDEDALAKVTTSSLLASTATMLSPSIHATIAAIGFDLSAPALDCEWMNRSFEPAEFEQVLLNPDVTLHTAVAPFAESDSESEAEEVQVQDIPATHVDFESLLDLEDLPEPVVPASKKRGRSAAAPSMAPPASKKAKTAAKTKAPATPKPHPLSRPTSDDPEDIERYVKYRLTNNEAACKSRLKRKEREQQNAVRVEELEDQNVALKKELSSLQGEVAKLKSLLEAHIRK